MLRSPGLRRPFVVSLVLLVAPVLAGLPALPAAAQPEVNPCSNGHIALTYDDGPNPPYTPELLDALKAKGAHATFFVIGSNAERHPALLKRAHAEDHQIGNHTWSHPRLPDLTNEEIRTELERTKDMIVSAGLPTPKIMRPPYGATNSRVREVVASMGLAHVLWTYDTNDWRRPPADKIVDGVLSNLHKDMNILMHDGGGDRSQTVLATPRVIDGARAAGYCLGALNADGNVVPAADRSIAFGDQDSGVPNYDRGDGVTFLDLVWANVSFDKHGDFVRVVEGLSRAWEAAGLFTQNERQDVLTAAAQSNVGRG